MTQWWSDGGVEIVATTGLFSSGRWLRYELQPLCGSVCSQWPSQTFQAHPALHEQPSWLLWFVSSALCLLSIFQSGRKRWSDLRSRCQLSSGLSEVLCQILLPAGPAGSKEINQEERPGRVWHRQKPFFFPVFFLLQQYYFFTKDILSDPFQWSFHLGECEGQLRSAKKWNRLHCVALQQLTCRSLYFLVLFPAVLSSD